ncbi:hypothetical protein CMQ_3744 [Grosmannia clavigera kw1407]|uniref:Gas1-like protein n=1 Tax=Grosmannia clavigera (strain kw1407 / UAMH 11150) TaxID=655863 RepID=F0X9R1_GROCL|nr:uncharacterized protein CMQ_3744 [Grosmannia clavigera kw1407]EFX05675.1 hypothetical protein CMQ_3744 [Grosmannia clavigera kw1407]
MQSFFRVDLTLAVFVSVAYGQGVIASAKGDVGISYGMQVEINNYADANYINQAEIVANAVNACGRTLLAGDISEAGVTEELLETGNYTTTTQGGTITMVISQRYANGSGPFACDLDEASNALGAYGQTNLTVTQNNADFGGCITVQQTDVTANVNTVDNIVTEEKKSAISAQVVQNQKDLPAAKKGLAAAGTTEKEGLYIVKAILAGDANIDKDAAADIVSSAASANGTTTTGTRKTRATRNEDQDRNGACSCCYREQEDQDQDQNSDRVYQYWNGSCSRRGRKQEDQNQGSYSYRPINNR